MTKYLFVTGGVLSSVGKGITASMLGRVLQERGYTVMSAKLDPYINVDPGTMSPYQHGEVFVLDDGTETDLDLGHYERLLDINLSRVCNFTTGQVYAEVIAKERRGDYLGGTIQVIPHITDEIKKRILCVADETKADIVMVEVGGTVGDYESLPFLEALREMPSEVGEENCFFIHVTWVPHIMASGELKTKPTQHSVRELRSIGISPDMIVLRSDLPLNEEITQKVARFCSVAPQAVVPMITADVLYDIPFELEKMGIGDYMMDKLGIKSKRKPTWRRWTRLAAESRAEKPTINLALVGKYVELHDAYKSVQEAITHAGLHNNVDVKIDWVQSEYLEDLTQEQVAQRLQDAAAIIVPGGFGERGIEGKINAIQYARQSQTPFLGLCLGMQLMSIEFARNVLHLENAHSTEFNHLTPHPIIDLMPEQRSLNEMGATMRLGLYPCRIQENTLAASLYKTDYIEERHRHRYEFNNQYRQQFENHGMILSGLSPDQRLVEIAEIKDHPYMIASQFHPEFLSRPLNPHPLFMGLISAGIERTKKLQK